MTRRPRQGRAPQAIDHIVFEDDDQQAAYARLDRHPWQATRWFDFPSIAVLELEAEIHRLASVISAQGLLHQQWPSYKALTLEFLSSFSHELHAKTGKGTISFRLGNERRTLSLTELNHIYGFSTVGRWKNLSKDDQNDIWGKLTGRTAYRGQTSKSSNIVHPCLRILHKFFSMTVFARVDTGGNIRNAELMFLSAMLHGEPVNIGYHLAKRFSDYSSRDRCIICIGGMITPIAEHFGIDLQRYFATPDDLRINMSYLGSCLYLDADDSGSIHWKLPQLNNKRCRLPDTARTPTTNPYNWYQAWVDIEDEPAPIMLAVPEVTTTDAPPLALAHQSPHFEQGGASTSTAGRAHTNSEERLARLESDVARVQASIDTLSAWLYYRDTGRTHDPHNPFLPPW